MAKVRQYGYIIKGRHIALVEKDTSFDNDVNAKDYGPGANKIQWKSALADNDNGLVISYAYTPKYRYNDSSDTKTGSHIYEVSGLLKIKTSSVHGLQVGDYFVIKDSERVNGLHKVKTVDDIYHVTTYSKYSGKDEVYESHETFRVYVDVDVLNDEEDEIDVSSYLSKALVWYVKARFLEDARDIEGHEYYMKKFKKMLEKHENSKIAGPRIVAPNSHLT